MGSGKVLVGVGLFLMCASFCCVFVLCDANMWWVQNLVSRFVPSYAELCQTIPSYAELFRIVPSCSELRRGKWRVVSGEWGREPQRHKGRKGHRGRRQTLKAEDAKE